MTTRWEARQDAVAKVKAHAAVLAIVPVESIFDSRIADFGEDEISAVIISTPSTRWSKARDRNTVPIYQRDWLLRIECFVAINELAGADPATVDAQLAENLDRLEEAVIEKALLSSGAFVACFQSIGEIQSGIRSTNDGAGRFAQSTTTFDLGTQATYNPEEATTGDDLETIALNVNNADNSKTLTSATIPIDT